MRDPDMKRNALAALLFCAFFPACETTEVVTEPAATPMTEAEFDAALKNAKASTDPYAGERTLTALIDQPGASADQKSRALYARATQRWKKTFDKAGAKSDFDKYVELYPDGVFTNNARYESGYVQNELQAARSRLQTVQTLRAWFDDNWVLGNRAEAASRYRRSGLTPEPHQVYQLRATGFICQNSGNLKVHNYGPLTPELQDLYWCK